MSSTSNSRPGHFPTLLACFLHFDLSFMIWVLIGGLGIFIAEDLGLNPAQKGFLVAVPILSGSLLRIPVGLLSDRIGGKRVGAALLAFIFVPLAWGWLGSGGSVSMTMLGLLLGVSGASFAVALPLASRWYPPHKQGLAMGIAAAGNSGTTLTHLFAPMIAHALGWRNVMGLAMIPLAVVLVAFMLLAKEPPKAPVVEPKPSDKPNPSVWKSADLWWFSTFYAVTFGGYVGLSSFLPLFLRDQYGLTPLGAGQLTAVAALTGSLARPLGGYIADKVGGVRMLLMLLTAIGTVYAFAASLPRLEVMAGAFIAGMACLGLGNGAVFQLVPQRFPTAIGGATGIIGAIGGVGGFFVPMFLGLAKHQLGSFGAGFAALALAAAGATVVLAMLTVQKPRWRQWLRAVPVPQAQ